MAENGIDLEECVAKCSMKRSNDDEKIWLVTNGTCEYCHYVGKVKIYYCRRASVYNKYIEQQLKLPFEEKK